MASSAAPVPPAIDTALAQVPVPMVVVRLSTGSYLRRNPAWEALFGDRAIDEIVPADDIAGVRELLQAVADGRLDGYLRHGRFNTADGRQISGHVSLQRLMMADAPDLAVTVIVPTEQEAPRGYPPEDTRPPPWTSFVGDVADLSVVVTDHDWRIEHASRDLEARLGYDLGSARGTALLGLVHPDDAGKLLGAIDGAITLKHATIARVRLRAADASWRELVCFVVPLCEHNPPRLAILLTGPGLAPATTDSARVDELEERLWRIALEVRAAGLIRDAGNAVPTTRIRESTELSGRQWEIVTRLVNGQRVPEIARAMYLSQSTVRNHLTVVFRKFGVHSQRELVAVLTSVARPPA